MVALVRPITGRGVDRSEGKGVECDRARNQPVSRPIVWVLRGTKRHVGFIIGWAATDIRTSYKEWRSRGAEFLTEPKDHGVEIRCYMRDPDGYLIEGGQTTAPQV